MRSSGHDVKDTLPPRMRFMQSDVVYKDHLKAPIHGAFSFISVQ